MNALLPSDAIQDQPPHFELLNQGVSQTIKRKKAAMMVNIKL